MTKQKLKQKMNDFVGAREKSGSQAETCRPPALPVTGTTIINPCKWTWPEKSVPVAAEGEQLPIIEAFADRCCRLHRQLRH